MTDSCDRIDYCDVCGAKGEVRVAASNLGPASFAYCGQCITHDAEPFLTVATRIFALGGPTGGCLDDLADVVTYDDGKYAGLAAVLEKYDDLEGGIRAEFT